jgi:hypothetical protein
MVKDATKLRKNYLASKYVLFDVLSILPTDMAYLFLSTTCFEQVPCPVIVRMNRVLRFDRMVEFFEKTETRTNYPNAFRITKVVLYILVLIHWNACLFFAISFLIGFESDTWVYQVRQKLWRNIFHGITKPPLNLGPWALGLLGPWALGPLGSWALGLLGPWALGPLGPWALGPLGSWALGLLGPWALGPLGSWALGLLGSWALGLLGSWSLKSRTTNLK